MDISRHQFVSAYKNYINLEPLSYNDNDRPESKLHMSNGAQLRLECGPRDPRK